MRKYFLRSRKNWAPRWCAPDRVRIARVVVPEDLGSSPSSPSSEGKLCSSCFIALSLSVVFSHSTKEKGQTSCGTIMQAQGRSDNPASKNFKRRRRRKGRRGRRKRRKGRKGGEGRRRRIKNGRRSRKERWKERKMKDR